MKEIAQALLKFQAEVPKIGKDAVNPYFKSKYASLENIWSTILPTLTKCGLVICQTTETAIQGDVIHLRTALIHTSGEMLEGLLSMKPSKADPQGMLACLTYARRGALSAILSLVTDDDLDGNDTVKVIEKIEHKKDDLDMSPPPAEKPLTRKQIIGQEIKNLNIPVANIESAIGKNFNKMVFAELTTPEAEVLLKWAVEYAKVM